MTLTDLLTELERIAQDCDPDITMVKLAIQPHWPFQHSIGQIVLVDVYTDDNRPSSYREDDDLPEPEPILYIAEADQECYLPEVVAEQLGWTR